MRPQGGAGLGKGVLHGLTGLVSAPVRGATEGGVSGACLGVCAGVAVDGLPCAPSRSGRGGGQQSSSEGHPWKGINEMRCNDEQEAPMKRRVPT